MGRRKKEPQSVHREAIASAAERLFAEKGIEAATMDEIAKAAGYSKATLYVYFTNKEEIAAALALKSMSLLHAYLQNAVNGPGGTKEKYMALCWALQKYYEEFPQYFELTLGEINVDLEGAAEPSESRTGRERLNESRTDRERLNESGTGRERLNESGTGRDCADKTGIDEECLNAIGTAEDCADKIGADRRAAGASGTGEDRLETNRETYAVGEAINEAMADFIRRGIRAGDLRADLQLPQTVFVFWAALSGLIRTAARKRSYLEKSMENTGAQFLEYGFQMLYRSIERKK